MVAGLLYQRRKMEEGYKRTDGVEEKAKNKSQHQAKDGWNNALSDCSLCKVDRTKVLMYLVRQNRTHDLAQLQFKLTKAGFSHVP